MKNIKTFAQYEGLGSWLRTKMNQHEKIADGILSELESLRKDDINMEFGEDAKIEPDLMAALLDYSMTYEFNLDGFQIAISRKHLGNLSNQFILKVDGEELKTSKNVNKRIFNKVDDIFEDKVEKEQERDHTLKDAQFRFANKK